MELTKSEKEVVERLRLTKETLELLRHNGKSNDYIDGMISAFNMHFPLFGDYEV